MKPINEKERTIAFVQFLVLFILTVILTIFFVFFPIKMRKKEYDALKEKVRTNANQEAYFKNLENTIDTIQTSINNLDKVDASTIEDSKYIIRDNLLKRLDSTVEDVSFVSPIKLKIKSICSYWMIDKAKLKEIDKLKAIGAVKDKNN